MDTDKDPNSYTEAPTPTDPAWQRVLALPLAPIVAAIDLTTVIFEAWAEWGTRRLNRLDPFFARFTRLMIRLGNWVAPATDRIGASIARLAAGLAPIIAAAGRLATGVGTHVRLVTQPLVHGFVAVRSIVRRAISPISTAMRQLASHLVAAASRTASRVRSTISALRRAARPRRRAAHPMARCCIHPQMTPPDDSPHPQMTPPR